MKSQRVLPNIMKDKIDVAIQRVRQASAMSERYMDGYLYVMISGGKDSSVIQQLAVDSGCKVRFIHSLTTVDAPDTVYFVRKEFERLRELGYECKIRRPPLSMWQLIIKRYGLPPLRTMRYCCHAIKERKVTTEDGSPAFIVTGVRWGESTARRERGEYEALASKKENRIILNNDNDLNRKLFEDCKLRSERVVNPIIDWTEEEVWQYIRDNNLPYNPLYDKGFKRVGCIGCPMASKKDRDMQFDLYPKFKTAYINAFQKGMEFGRSMGKEYTWEGGEGAFQLLDRG